jgi:hypothetical protein
MHLANVDAQPNWRGQPDTTHRRLLWLVLVSLLLHVPMTPLIALLGLLGSLADPDETAPALPPITAIPVDLIPGDEPAGGTPEPPAPTEPPSAPDKPSVSEVEAEAPKPKPKKRDESSIADAGPDETETDAAAALGADAQVAAADAGAPGPGRAIGDPVAMSGAVGKVADANANVRVVIYNERIRNHPLGPRIGRARSDPRHRPHVDCGPTAARLVRGRGRVEA